MVAVTVERKRKPKPIYCRCHGGPIKQLRYDYLPNGQPPRFDDVVPVDGGRYVRFYQPETDSNEFIWEGAT